MQEGTIYVIRFKILACLVAEVQSLSLLLTWHIPKKRTGHNQAPISLWYSYDTFVRRLPVNTAEFDGLLGLDTNSSMTRVLDVFTLQSVANCTTGLNGHPANSTINIHTIIARVTS